MLGFSRAWLDWSTIEPVSLSQFYLDRALHTIRAFVRYSVGRATVMGYQRKLAANCRVSIAR